MQVIQIDDSLQPATEDIQAAVKHLYRLAPQFKRIEKVAGPLMVRRGSPTFATLVRIVIGQQLAIKAAASIYARLSSAVSLTPKTILNAPESALRQAGLSKSKVTTCLAIAEAIHERHLEIEK